MKNITEVLKASGLDRNSLEIKYYRKRQREIIKKINASKVGMYWMNNNNIELFD